ncbi:terpene cyclase/mutase family protein [Akkermansiaceae bacterium]|nr:terpene cyclase/mutase family protein [Akkermansiaceae bacterium]
MTRSLLKHQILITITGLGVIALPLTTHAQSRLRDSTDTVPTSVETIYKKGLRYLSTSQEASGVWSGSGSRPGIIGLCTLAFLAYGEDPNHGPYAENIQKCINQLILAVEDGEDGFMGNQMYDHGFATLALAECYGMVDDPRIAPALKKAVDLILKAQKVNPKKAWRYSPLDTSADTTVSGCQIVALLGARNAGIPVPDEAINQALAYMKSCRNDEGAYGYTSPSSPKATLTAIGSLCYSLAKKKDDADFEKSTNYLKENIQDQGSSHPFYFRYYMAQALFQADEELWEQWNKDNIRLLSSSQLGDGSFASNYGNAYSTASSLLSLALNYRFLPIYEK